jgi:hypothetical protein
MQLFENFGFKHSSIQFGCRQLFSLAHISGRSSLNTPFPIHDLSNRMILFIQGENRKGLSSLTAALYSKIQPRKEMISVKTSRIHMMGAEDQKSYDRQVANFFQVNLK